MNIQIEILILLRIWTTRTSCALHHSPQSLYVQNYMYLIGKLALIFLQLQRHFGNPSKTTTFPSNQLKILSLNSSLNGLFIYLFCFVFLVIVIWHRNDLQGTSYRDRVASQRFFLGVIFLSYLVILPIKVYNSFGELYLELNWIHGLKNYLISVVKLHTNEALDFQFAEVTDFASSCIAKNFNY